MTYNQVQLFQINDYVNHHVDIEITGCRILYSKSIADRGIARLIKFSQQGQLTALIECLTVILEYIDLYCGIGLGPLLAMPLKGLTQPIFKI